MKLHVCTPYSTEKNLGRAYNEAAANVNAEWLCFIDHDVHFLTPDAITMMHKYIDIYPDTGLFTCRTNRIHPLATAQHLGVSENDSVRFHEDIAEDRRLEFPKVTEIDHPISGFLMMFSKKTWQKVKFQETGECLGVDNFFSQDILNSGRNILCMEAVYVFHAYRLHDIKDKSHLR